MATVQHGPLRYESAQATTARQARAATRTHLHGKHLRPLPTRASFGPSPRWQRSSPPTRRTHAGHPGAPSGLGALLDSRRVILCVGCGGVGKTTTSAALGLAAARRGKRVLCLTIDPARRLSQTAPAGQIPISDAGQFPSQGLTEEQIQMFEEGNQDMMKHFESSLDKVRYVSVHLSMSIDIPLLDCFCTMAQSATATP